jgi:hypothetical protein
VNFQRRVPSSSQDRPPWSPLIVALVSLFLPMGGAPLTIRNLERLHTVEREQARQLIVAVIGIFAVGFTILYVLTKPSPQAFQSLGTDVSTLLSAGTAVASYLVQRGPYIAWRSRNSELQRSSWLGAVGSACVYALVWALAMIPVLVFADIISLAVQR